MQGNGLCGTGLRDILLYAGCESPQWSKMLAELIGKLVRLPSIPCIGYHAESFRWTQNAGRVGRRS